MISEQGDLFKVSLEGKILEKRHTDFVAQFVALWRAAFSDFGTLFLVLMLEAAFLMIEIFPTYQKLRTKIGDYDWAIYYKEKGFQEKIKLISCCNVIS